MSLEFHSVTFRSPDARRDAEFWAAVLGRSLHTDDGGILLPGGLGQVGIRFEDGPAHGVEMNRLHLHLSRANRNQRDTIAACVESGGRLRGNGHVPENSYAAMADPVGDEFCVIEDENGYLAGCGPLGEVTCDGTKAAGLFWGAALGWPVVWDVGEEVAIQSPIGGTKLAWGGEDIDPAKDRERQVFVLTASADELAEEVDRLVDLGASDRGEKRTGITTLRDPDGIEFEVRTRR
ncbi:VOC family protein [Leifsonia poae]|uniref:VOC family protein n=1 Tax=Leifsonia poae TaxID=110933 RepID=UPI003D680062